MKPVPQIKSKWRAKGSATLLVGLTALVILLYILYGRGFLQLSYVKSHLAEIVEIYRRYPYAVILLYGFIYVVFSALALPGSIVLSLLGGALFGTWLGTVIISLASTVGSTVAFLLSRYLFRDYIQKRYGDRLQELNRRFDEDGLYYLFFLRLNPIIPFFMINSVMGLSRISTAAFFWCSQIGMLPGTFLYVNAGTQLARIHGLSEILSWQVILSLTLLGIFPLAIKKIFRWLGMS